MRLFVYYKFLPEEFPDLEREVRALQEAIVQALPGVKTGLLRRPDVNDKAQETWMETYELNASDLESLRTELQRLVRQHRIPQSRAYEVFVAV